MYYLFLVLGFVLLVKGADIFVEGSSAIANYFRIPSFIIGLTIVAFGTSAPEAAVSITAAVSGQNGIAVGNVIGSNIFNLLMVLGICSIIKPCPVSASILKEEYPLSIGATLLLIVLCLVPASPAGTLLLSRIDGIIFLAVFAVFIIVTIKKSLASPQDEDDSPRDSISLPKSIILSIVGIAGIIWGGQLVVENATEIAVSFGVSQTLIGLTIVAIGTSLPELVTSGIAAAKGKTDIAVGNVIGSNLFNILFVLGASVTVHPISVEQVSIYDAIILLAATLIVMGASLRKKQTGKLSGIIFILLYAIYTGYILMR